MITPCDMSPLDTNTGCTLIRFGLHSSLKIRHTMALLSTGGYGSRKFIFSTYGRLSRCCPVKHQFVVAEKQFYWDLTPLQPFRSRIRTLKKMPISNVAHRGDFFLSKKPCPLNSLPPWYKYTIISQTSRSSNDNIEPSRETVTLFRDLLIDLKMCQS